jgi:GTPase SAR1 family protein
MPPEHWVRFRRQQTDANGPFITVQIGDSAGQEHYQALVSSFYRRLDICNLVYDITVESSLSNIELCYRDFAQQTGRRDPNFPFLLIGNKLDDEAGRVLATKRGKHFAEERGFLFCDGSAKSCENIAVAFDGIVQQVSTITMHIRRKPSDASRWMNAVMPNGGCQCSVSCCCGNVIQKTGPRA